LNRNSISENTEQKTKNGYESGSFTLRYFYQELLTKRMLSLLIFLAAYLFILKFAIENFENFVFKSDFKAFEKWYPVYHGAIYPLVLLIRFILISSPILIVIILRKQLKEFFLSIKIGLSRTKLFFIQSLQKKNKPLKYLKAFLIYNIGLLALALFAYFFIQYRFNGDTAFDIQLRLSRIYIIAAIMGFIAYLIFFNLEAFLIKIQNFLFQPTSAYNLAVYRIAFFLILGLFYLEKLRQLHVTIECNERVTLPFIGWFIKTMPITSELYFYVVLVGIICCVFLVLGLFSRLFLWINAITVLYIIAVPNFYGKLWHSHFSIWISWFLLFAPIADEYSIDKILFKKNSLRRLSPDYNFPIKIVWLQFGIIYFWAGFYKLWDVGFDWALGETMINQVRLEWFEHFDKLPIFRIDYFPIILHIGGLLCILFELIFGVLLFHPKLKYISIVGGILMHNIIGIFMYIAFKKLQIQYVVFINFEKVLKLIKRNFSKFPYNEVLGINQDNHLNKKMIYLSLLILFMNFIFGMFNISSFPFSTYPTYSEKVENSKEYFHYRILDTDKKNMDVWALGKKKKFRWENFTRLEYAIINKYREQKYIDSTAIYHQWQWWSSRMDELKDVDSVNVFIIKRHLNPDSSRAINNPEFLLKIYPNKLEK
jgi:hypothetical protein